MVPLACLASGHEEQSHYLPMVRCPDFVIPQGTVSKCNNFTLFTILSKAPHLYALIFQWNSQLKDLLLILEWVFLSNQPTKTLTTPQELMATLIRKGRARLYSLARCKFSCIYIPLAAGEELEHLLQNNENLQFTLDNCLGQISIRATIRAYLATNYLNQHSIWFPNSSSQMPLKALTVFTDGSGSFHKSMMTWKDPRTQKWVSDVQVVEGSPQIAKLAAVVRAFKRYQQPFNLVTDSADVAGVAMRAEHSFLKEVSNPNLYKLLSKLVKLISHRKQSFHAMHVKPHTNLPGAITRERMHWPC